VSERISLLLLLRQYKHSISKASPRTFGLSTVMLFASNDSKTSFELRKKWPLNLQLRQFFEDKYLTSADNFLTTAQQSNFVCSNDKFVGDMGHKLVKKQKTVKDRKKSITTRDVKCMSSMVTINRGLTAAQNEGLFWTYKMP
jgi:hypothetical protein